MTTRPRVDYENILHGPSAATPISTSVANCKFKVPTATTAATIVGSVQGWLALDHRGVPVPGIMEITEFVSVLSFCQGSALQMVDSLGRCLMFGS